MKYEELDTIFKRFEELSYKKYDSYSFACGFYSSLLKNVMCGYTTIEDAKFHIQLSINMMEGELIETK